MTVCTNDGRSFRKSSQSLYPEFWASRSKLQAVKMGKGEGRGECGGCGDCGNAEELQIQVNI
jgi:hypothetical protein